MAENTDNPWIKHRDKPIRNLVISGGSIGGLTIAGAWRALEEVGYAKTINNFAGCSVGSIFSLLLSLGYTSHELSIICKKFRYKDYASLSILQVFEQLGLENGEHIMCLLRRLVEMKTGYSSLTFRQHYNITGRELWVNAYCIEDDCCVYYSAKNSPDMQILQAVRMSISIPVILTAVEYEGKTYVDGGLGNVFPLKLFPAEETVGLYILNTEAQDNQECDRFSRFILSLLKNLYKRVSVVEQVEEYRIIEIYTGVSSLSLDLRLGERKKLMARGYEATSKKINFYSRMDIYD